MLLRCSRWPRIVLLSALAIGSTLLCNVNTLMARQAEQAPAAAPASKPAALAEAATAVDPAIQSAVDDFWHYAKIARYDLANAEAAKILSHSDQAGQVLRAFEKTSADRKDDLDQWLLRWQGVNELRDSATKLITVVNAGRAERRSDLAFVEQNIERLNNGERAYGLAMIQIRQSGELAVPLLINYLRDPNKRDYHSVVRSALKDLGRVALNPLCASTEMKDADTLGMVAGVLGEIGYDASVPYLLRLAKAPDQPESVRLAATQALMHMGAGDPKEMDPASAFYDLAEKLYYDNAALTYDPRNPVAYVWYWDSQSGLTKKDVPPAIFNEIMAMRECEYALKLNAGMTKAVSLWLASNYKREAELPEGAKDPTRAEGQPNAHYYGVAAGTQYLNQVLARALHDHNSQVAFRSVKSLEEITGESNLFSGEESSHSVTQALNYSDRLVRFEAAFSLANAMPQKNFSGATRVVPILSEAIAQTGRPTVLLLVPSQDMINTVTEALKDTYTVAGATNADQALNESNRLPGVDVIVISEDVPQAQIDRMFMFSSQTSRLEGAAKLIITHSPASRFAASTINNPMISITQAQDAAGLKLALTDARKRAGSLTMDEKMATDYALRASDALGKLAINRTPVYDLAVAEPTLLAALDDPRADLVKACGKVLAMLNSRSSQLGLLTKAAEDKTSDELKIALYKDLAVNAKFYGNLLEAESIDKLQKVVASAANLDVRSAAAEARGALNLPAEQAKTLILQQSRM